MELDLKKKIIIGSFITLVLLILGYLYYDYINRSNDNSINIENNLGEEETKSSLAKNFLLNERDAKEENIIIVHLAGAVKNPRNCKNKRRFKVI